MSQRLVLLFLCIAGIASGQRARNVKQEVAWLRNSLLEHHVEAKKIDDNFSRDLFDKVFDDLDPDRIFFTQADLASLEPYRANLDDEINSGRIDFLTRLKDCYKAALLRSEKSITATLAAPIDWKKKELYDPEPQWAADENALATRHRQWLKYLVLDRLSDLLQRDSVPAAGFFARHVADAIAYVRLTALRPINRMLKDPALYENKISNAYLQAMASLFDPHSTFFSTADYDDFVGSLSTEDYFFGFMLDEDGKGNVVISALSPGGPAWKSGNLHVSDILVGVKWPNEETIDVHGMDIDDVNEIFAGNASDMLEMIVLGADGREKKVALKKEKQESEQNVVQSFILEGAIRAGYIYLPDFYTRWGNEQEGGRCANDVAKEIIRLKNERIDGIILDLRFNGGGSLFEARAMAGIFIDEGPLAMVTTREKKVVTLKDINRGTVYDGPLVLMVSALSASASEVLAASIQDYNRGLIVGSPTYGKATGQNVFPIEGVSATSGVNKTGESGAGYVKVTTQKLFRVTGKSAQGKGVTPDIFLPDIFSALKLGENHQPFALKGDSVPPNSYFKPLKPFKRDELRRLSRERLEKNVAFRELQETIRWMEEEMQKDTEPWELEWDTHIAAILEERKNEDAADRFKSPDKVYTVSNAQFKEQRLLLDEYGRALNDRWLEQLGSDIYLQETFRILSDHISLIKNP